MRKYLQILPVLAAVLLSCGREADPLPSGEEVEGRVTVEFHVSAGSAATKALQDTEELKSLHLAVFGNSGYLKEYVEAQLTGTGVYVQHYQDAYGQEKTQEVPEYTFKATLTLSTKPRTVHFIGNGPATLRFAYANSVLPALLSRQGEGAYWQMLSLDRGVRARRDASGEYIKEDGNYVADEETVEAFSHVPLVRNWAKIEMHEPEEDSNFTPVSFAVVNVPGQGTIVPYSVATGFLQDYIGKSFTDLENAGYPASLPPGTEFDSAIPDTFASVDRGESVYLYERPVPSEELPPTYVIVYGHYRNESDADPSVTEGDYYYKIDLMETDPETGESAYYPIYRNFKYAIKITKISAPGQSSAALAAASHGSADVSADIQASHLPEISDGTALLAVNPSMALTFSSAQTDYENLSVKFLPNIYDDTPAPDAISLTRLPMENGGDNVILDGYTLLPAEAEGEGWRHVRFSTVAPSHTVQSQKLRISGTYVADGQTRKLYRDVQIVVQPLQAMKVTCQEGKVPRIKGSPVAVDVTIPDGLPSTMFPLEFCIEAQDMSLEPDASKEGNNLPVVSGKSLTGSGKTVFQFIRTLTWEDYNDLPWEQDAEGYNWRTLTCHFKTNRDDSATTVWVSNAYFRSEYAHDSFLNAPTFLNLAFTTPIPRAIGGTVGVAFSVDNDPVSGFPDILIHCRGLIPVWDSPREGPEADTYYYQASDQNVSLSFQTNNKNGEASVSLSADEYASATLEPWHFNQGMPVRSYGLLEARSSDGVWSNVAYERVQVRKDKDSSTEDNRTVVFGYYDDPEALNAPVTLTDMEGNVLGTTNASNKSGLKMKNPTSFPWTPTGPYKAAGVPSYHEMSLITSKLYASEDISFQLSSPGYVTESFHYGRLATQTVLHTHTNVPISQYDAQEHTIVPPSSVDATYFQIRFDPLEGAPDPVLSDGKLLLGQDASGACTGGRYRITFRYGDLSGILPFNLSTVYKRQRFYYAEFTMTSPNIPAAVSPATGVYYAYPGSSNVYVWSVYETTDEYVPVYTDIPAGERSIVFEVGSRPVIISRILYKAISDIP